MYAMLYMTAGSEEEARRLVRHLVDERLVACGNIFPIRSIYRWEGQVTEEAEAAVIMKTRTSLVPRAMEELQRLHSYDVPCVVSYAMERGLEPYLAWVDDVTS